MGRCRGGRVGGFAAVLLVVVGLGVCLAACSDSAGTGGQTSIQPGGLATFVARSSPTGPVASPTPGPALRCTAHASEGAEDDSVRMALNCAVTHAPSGDTSFSLHFGVTDPVGNVHAFDAACDGTLQNGAGSCSQTYDFIFPFAAKPGPVSGMFAPSKLRVGPVLPASV